MPVIVQKFHALFERSARIQMKHQAVLDGKIHKQRIFREQHIEDLFAERHRHEIHEHIEPPSVQKFQFALLAIFDVTDSHVKTARPMPAARSRARLPYGKDWSIR